MTWKRVGSFAVEESRLLKCDYCGSEDFDLIHLTPDKAERVSYDIDNADFLIQTIPVENPKVYNDWALHCAKCHMLIEPGDPEEIIEQLEERYA